MEKERKEAFILLFESKNGLPRHKAGELYESHTEAEKAASHLTSQLKKAYSGVGKVAYRQ